MEKWAKDINYNNYNYYNKINQIINQIANWYKDTQYFI